MWTRCRLARGNARCVRVVAACATEAHHVALAVIPEAAYAAMCSGFPIAIRRPVTTAAERRDIVEFQFAAVAHLERGEVLFVVAVVKEVVSVVRTVAHHDVGVLLGNNDLLVRVVANRRRILFFVAAIAVVIREILFRLDEVGVGPAPRRGLKEFFVDERNVLLRWQVAPKIFCEQCGERDKPNRQPREEKIRAGAIAPRCDCRRGFHDAAVDDREAAYFLNPRTTGMSALISSSVRPSIAFIVTLPFLSFSPSLTALKAISSVNAACTFASVRSKMPSLLTILVSPLPSAP